MDCINRYESFRPFSMGLIIAVLLFIVNNGKVLTDGVNERKYLKRDHKIYILGNNRYIYYYSMILWFLSFYLPKINAIY